MSEVAIHEDFLGCFGLLRRDEAWLLVGNRRVLVQGGAPDLVFDLPGGRVESGETLEECLQREWQEECALEVEVGRFRFVQEGIRRIEGVRHYAWRSFFFEVQSQGEPRASSEIESLLWCPDARLPGVLQAPYHQGFLRYLENGESYQFDVWDG